MFVVVQDCEDINNISDLLASSMILDFRQAGNEVN